MKDCIADAFRKGALQHVVDSQPMVALYTRQAMFDAATQRYTPDNEVRGDGYQSGGLRLEGATVVETSQGFSLVMHSPVWQNATITACGAMIYLAADAGRAIRFIDFGRDISSTNDSFRIKFPSAEDGGVVGI